MKTSLENRWVQWGLTLAGLTFVALYYTTQRGAHSVTDGFQFSWWRVLRGELTYCYLWALLIPAIVFVDRHFPIAKGSLLRGSLAHLCSSILLSALHQLALVVVLPVLGYGAPSSPFWQYLELLVLGNFHLNLTFYWGILGVRYVFDSYRKHRERELRSSQLETQLAQAHLQVLKMQLQPHFLFNTLHTISVLMAEDTETANRMIVRLSDLLRMTLDNVGAQEVSLKQEVEFVQRYLEIQQIRFQDRLMVHVDVDSSALDALVPSLLLQPLIENAIRHGIARRAGGGLVAISARREGDKLLLDVRDNGEGLTEPRQGSQGNGMGLATTRARLNQLYGVAHRFEICNATGGGVRVSVVLPFRRAEEERATRG